MREFLSIRGFVALAAFSAGSIAVAGPITLNDFSGGESLIDFTDGAFPGGGGPTVYHGVTFTENTGGSMSGGNNWGAYFANIPGSSQGLGFNDQVGDSDIRLDFPNGTQRAGMILSTGPQTLYAIDAYGPGNAYLGTMQGSMPQAQQAVFLGWEDAGGLSYLRIYEPNGDNGNIMLMDDIRHEAIPAPSAAALLGLGALAAARRRR